MVVFDAIIPMLRNKTTDVRTHERYIYCRIVNSGKKLKNKVNVHVWVLPNLTWVPPPVAKQSQFTDTRLW